MSTKKDQLKDKVVSYLWRKLKPYVDSQITGRIVTFHRALIDRGQIKRPPKEEVLESSTVCYMEDRISQ